MKLKAVGANRVIDDVADPGDNSKVLLLPQDVVVTIVDDLVKHSVELRTKIKAGEVIPVGIGLGVDAQGFRGADPLDVTEGNFYWVSRTINYDPAVVAHVHKYDMQPVAEGNPNIHRLPGFDEFIPNTLQVFDHSSSANGIRMKRVGSGPLNAGEFVQLTTNTFQTGASKGGASPILAADIRVDYQVIITSGQL